MKKIIYSLATLFVVALASISICSCGSDDNDTPTTTKEIVVKYSTDFHLYTNTSYTEAQKVPADSLKELIQARVKTLVGGDTFKLASDDGKKPTDVAIAALKSKLSSDAEIIRLKKEVLSIMDSTGKVTLFYGVFVKLVDKVRSDAWQLGDESYWVLKLDI